MKVGVYMQLNSKKRQLHEFLASVQQRWYSDIGLPTSPNDLREDKCYVALALAGEVGELCDHIKKELRDGVDCREDIRYEIVDTLFYLLKLASVYDIDIDASWDSKMEILDLRERGLKTG